mmetsp:Transcript_70331/g.147240  ORF Transcript_70331/g.147240 Transcript_70331/m.147240 type:complete len:114 (+) Transcript_70331:2-343(+)
MVISDDSTDSSIFKFLPKDRAYTVRVGLGETAARHRFLDWDEAEQYLKIIVDDDPLGLEQSSESLLERFQTCMGDANTAVDEDVDLNDLEDQPESKLSPDIRPPSPVFGPVGW